MSGPVGFTRWGWGLWGGGVLLFAVALSCPLFAAVYSLLGGGRVALQQDPLWHLCHSGCDDVHGEHPQSLRHQHWSVSFHSPSPPSTSPRYRSRWVSNGNLYLLNNDGKVPFLCPVSCCFIVSVRGSQSHADKDWEAVTLDEHSWTSFKGCFFFFSQAGCAFKTTKDCCGATKNLVTAAVKIKTPWYVFLLEQTHKKISFISLKATILIF